MQRVWVISSLLLLGFLAAWRVVVGNMFSAIAQTSDSYSVPATQWPFYACMVGPCFSLCIGLYGVIKGVRNRRPEYADLLTQPEGQEAEEVRRNGA